MHEALPVSSLSNVRVDASGATLSRTATDMDLTIVETIPAEVSAPGATTAPAHTLYDIVRKLPEGAQVQIDSGGDGSQLAIRAGRSRFTLATLPRDDFPAGGQADLPHSFSLAAADLQNGRAAGRARVSESLLISVGAVYFK